MKSNNKRRTVGRVFGVALLVVGLLAAHTPRETLAQPNAFHFTLIATLVIEPGAFIRTSLNNGGDIAFAGIVPTTAGISGDLGMGIFRADKKGQISSVVSPGISGPRRRDL